MHFNHIRNTATWASGLALAISLACGGGGGSNSNNGSPNPPTPSTTGTTAALAGSFGGTGTLDGTGSLARLENASGLTLDTQGNAYVLGDQEHHNLRKVTSAGQVLTLRKGQDIETAWAGQELRACGPVLAPDGSLLIYSAATNTLYRIAADGKTQSTVSLPSLGMQTGEAVIDFTTDSGGNTLYVLTGYDPHVTGQNVQGRLLKVSSGVVTNLSSGSQQVFSRPVRLDASGNVMASTLVISGGSYVPGLFVVAPNGTQSTVVFSGWPVAPSGTNQSVGVHSFLPSAGGYYVAASVARYQISGPTLPTQGMVLFQATSSGVLTPFAGSLTSTAPADGPFGTGAFGSWVQGLCQTMSGTLLVMSTGVLQSVSSSGTITLLAGAAPQHGLIDGKGSDARFLACDLLTVDTQGNAYLPDGGYSSTGVQSASIRKIATDGTVSLFAGSYTSTGSADGALGTGSLVVPSAITTDSQGVVWFLQTGSSASQWVLRSASAGTLSTVATFTFTTSGTTTAPSAMVSDGHGNFVVAVNWWGASTRGALIYQLTQGGGWTILGGSTSQGGLNDGPGSTRTFDRINALTRDSAGNIYVTEAQNVVRKLDSSGVLSTIAGNPGQAGITDGAGTSALFSRPWGIAVKADGSVVYVADYLNGTIRKVTPSGTVTTVAGTPGTVGPTWGNLPGTLPNPYALALAPNGDLLVTTEGGVFKVSGL